MGGGGANNRRFMRPPGQQGGQQFPPATAGLMGGGPVQGAPQQPQGPMPSPQQPQPGAFTPNARQQQRLDRGQVTMEQLQARNARRQQGQSVGMEQFLPAPNEGRPAPEGWGAHDPRAIDMRGQLEDIYTAGKPDIVDDIPTIDAGAGDPLGGGMGAQPGPQNWNDMAIGIPTPVNQGGAQPSGPPMAQPPGQQGQMRGAIRNAAQQMLQQKRQPGGRPPGTPGRPRRPVYEK